MEYRNPFGSWEYSIIVSIGDRCFSVIDTSFGGGTNVSLPFTPIALREYNDPKQRTRQFRMLDSAYREYNLNSYNNEVTDLGPFNGDMALYKE